MGKQTYRLGMNQFGDMTSDEFTQLMNGYNSGSALNILTYTSNSEITATAVLPGEVDWRQTGYVTPVKDQGQCGSCWAFSATGSLEGQHYKKTGMLVSLSEQNLIDCSWPQGNKGCNGGSMARAFQYVKSNGGINPESSYPYTGTNGQPCQYDAQYNAANCLGYTYVKSGDENALKTAVASKGPISVAMDASQFSFQFYSSGIYNEIQCSSTKLNHGVLVTGYGYSGQTETTLNKYWIVKNSWGASWGMQGYFYLARNQQNKCGVATAALYPLV
ncbi:procathepsin L-like [Protopterus annectens]|uniref:procathepsin L-like n=1 Tax=Protopterus annectens TaxID=7888 RepID=UPI001CFA09F4|nr:procathepsin L-like [Protopterus annectens]